MKTLILKYRIFICLIIIGILIFSCSQNKTKNFPIVNENLMSNMNYGHLLAYAIYDNSKIEKVKSIMCDSLNKSPNIVFQKITIIDQADTFFFFTSMNRNNFIDVACIDWKRIINIDFDNLDSLSWKRTKFHINDLNTIIDSIAILSSSKVTQIIEQRQIKNMYIPLFLFVVNLKTYDCNNGFVEKTIALDNRINKLMDQLAMEIYPNKSILIRPNIEIKVE